MKPIKAVYGILKNPNYGSYIYANYVTRVAYESGILEGASCIIPALNELYSGVVPAVYPQRIPEGAALPAIVLSQISRVAYDTKKQYSKSDISRVQITIVAETATQVYDLSDDVRKYMSAIAPRIYNDVLVQNIAFDTELTITDDSANEQGVFMVVQDYLVMFSND